MDQEKIKVVVVIPTYNEITHIEKLLSEISRFCPEFDILVVDDNSPDGTGNLVDEISKTNKRAEVLHRPSKNGLGSAYLDGFKYILLKIPHYDRVIQMDADFSHDPACLSDLINATKDKDISIGSRYTTGGEIADWEFSRRILSWMANFFVRFWLGLKVNDCTSGFRCFRREVLEKILPGKIKSGGYFFQIELLTLCLHLGYTVSEIPIIFVERKQGKTKLGFYEIWEAICGVLILRFLKRKYTL